MCGVVAIQPAVWFIEPAIYVEAHHDRRVQNSSEYAIFALRWIHQPVRSLVHWMIRLQSVGLKLMGSSLVSLIAGCFQQIRLRRVRPIISSSTLTADARDQAFFIIVCRFPEDPFLS